MNNKVRQITDSIHGTIYISEFEHRMMSTPFFYRLHDVYQSSTVYMTFPANRTKRFEHSLGTMELAGRMFYSAVTNASIEDQKNFLEELQVQFDSIMTSLETRYHLEKITIYQAEAMNLGKLMPKNKCNMDEFSKLLKAAMTKSPLLTDRALYKQEICFMDLLSSDTDDSIGKLVQYNFLYQCVLEALRVAALFHDIGHPPFSHIIEFTLQRLYKRISSANYVEDKVKTFNRCLEKYIQCDAVESMLLDINCENAVKDPALHEQIGSHILYNTYRRILNQFVSEWKKDTGSIVNRLQTFYLITVMEFTFGILLEKAPVFSSLHRIIDGPIDADRLDYIVRDSRNSGADWGVIPYSRLISAIKFVYKNNSLKIAFPEKICDDIDDLLVNRFKIFQRINYHHKSVRTSELLQRTVEMLAEDYLLSQKDNEILPDIRYLWESLDATFGYDEVENKISQWTDSWLVSVLSNTLSKLSDSDTMEDLIDLSIGRTKDKLETLYKMLEEVQLNRKRYFPLLKRQRDALLLKSMIVEKAGITEEALDKLITHEYNKLINEIGDRADSAREALFRIELLRNEVLQVANFDLLDVFLPAQKSYNEIIQDILQQEKDSGAITDYFIWKNTGFSKLGVSDTTDITLYRRGNEAYKYDVSTSLMRKLYAQRTSCLWMFLYACFSENTEEQVDKKIINLFDKIATAIAENIHEQMNILFDFDTVLSNAS